MACAEQGHGHSGPPPAGSGMPPSAGSGPPRKRRGRLPIAPLAGMVAVVLAALGGIVIHGLVLGNREQGHRYAAPPDVCALVPLDRLDGWAGSSGTGKVVASGPRACKYRPTGPYANVNRLTLTVKIGDRVGDGFQAMRKTLKALPDMQDGMFHNVPDLGAQAHTYVRAKGQSISQTMSLFDGNLVLTARFAGYFYGKWAVADVENRLIVTLREALESIPRASASATESRPGDPSEGGYDASDPCALVVNDDLESWLGTISSRHPESPPLATPPATRCVLTTSGRGGSQAGGSNLNYEFTVGDDAAFWYNKLATSLKAVSEPVSGVGDQAFTYEPPGYRTVDLRLIVRDGNRGIALQVSVVDPELSHAAAREHAVALARATLARLSQEWHSD